MSQEVASQLDAAPRNWSIAAFRMELDFGIFTQGYIHNNKWLNVELNNKPTDLHDQQGDNAVQ